MRFLFILFPHFLIFLSLRSWFFNPPVAPGYWSTILDASKQKRNPWLKWRPHVVHQRCYALVWFSRIKKKCHPDPRSIHFYCAMDSSPVAFKPIPGPCARRQEKEKPRRIHLNCRSRLYGGFNLPPFPVRWNTWYTHRVNVLLRLITSILR